MVLATDLFDVLTALGIAAVAMISCILVVALAAIGCAGFFFGRNSVDARSALASARRERRLLREMKLWQEKVLLLRGAGPLERPAETTQDTGKRMRFTTPSEVAAELRGKANTAPQAPTLTAVPKRQPVPAAIHDDFLKESGAAVSVKSS